MTVAELILGLTDFADFFEQYEQASAGLQIDVALRGWRRAWDLQQQFRATAVIDRVRAYVLAQRGAELTIGTARRLLGDLIRERGLTIEAAEELPLETAMDLLETPPPAASTATPPPPEPSAAAAPQPAPAVTTSAEQPQSAPAPLHASETPVPPAPPAKTTPYSPLLAYAADELKGNERRAVEVLCHNNGSLALKDFALAMGWNCNNGRIDDKQWSSLQTRLNEKKKLRRQRWRLSRRDNHAILRPLESPTKK